MTNYPYYILAFFDAGILRKIFNDKKFNCYNDCVKAFDNLKENKFRSNILKRQILFLEYTAEYQGKIITIYNNHVTYYISEPIKND